MQNLYEIIAALEEGEYDEALRPLYAPDGSGDRLLRARERAKHTAESLLRTFPSAGGRPAILVSGPGRTELGGNHTDHQHGHVLCGSVDMDMLGCAAPNGENMIRVVSEGYPPVETRLDELSPRPEEAGASAALVRGVAAKIAKLGHTLAGFDFYVVSNVLSGSGLSSSAAYEILLGNAINRLCCADALDPAALAEIGQYAENVYFGKPCGLMDQMGSSVGGAVAIDFKDPANPAVEKADYDFSRSGHALCIVDTGSDHADLTDAYAAIPREMGAVAAYFGQRFLRDVPEAEFRAAIPSLRRSCGDRAVLRAKHFFNEDRRAVQEAAALNAGDFSRFLELVNASGLSSELYLQNVLAGTDPRRQAVALSLALGRELLDGGGAIRVHGGGFAGTIQAFVPNERLEHFRSGMETVLGEGKCHVLHIRRRGGCVIDPI